MTTLVIVLWLALQIPVGVLLGSALCGRVAGSRPVLAPVTVRRRRRRR
jgi:hypothetical protein